MHEHLTILGQLSRYFLLKIIALIQHFPTFSECFFGLMFFVLQGDTLEVQPPWFYSSALGVSPIFRVRAYHHPKGRLPSLKMVATLQPGRLT